MFLSPCFFRNEDGVDDNDDFGYNLIPEANLCTDSEKIDLFSVATTNVVGANCTGSSLFEEEHASGNPNAESPAGLENVTNNVDKPSFNVLVDLVSTSISQLTDFKSNDKDSPQVCQHSTVPTFNSVLGVLKGKHGIDLDTEQKNSI